MRRGERGRLRLHLGGAGLDLGDAGREAGLDLGVERGGALVERVGAGLEVGGALRELLLDLGLERRAALLELGGRLLERGAAPGELRLDLRLERAAALLQLGLGGDQRVAALDELLLGGGVGRLQVRELAHPLLELLLGPGTARLDRAELALVLGQLDLARLEGGELLGEAALPLAQRALERLRLGETLLEAREVRLLAAAELHLGAERGLAGQRGLELRAEHGELVPVGDGDGSGRLELELRRRLHVLLATTRELGAKARAESLLGRAGLRLPCGTWHVRLPSSIPASAREGPASIPRMGCPRPEGSVSVSRVRSTASAPPRLSAHARTCARPGSASSASPAPLWRRHSRPTPSSGPTSSRSGPSRPERVNPDASRSRSAWRSAAAPPATRTGSGANTSTRSRPAHEVQRARRLDDLAGDLLRVRRACVQRLAGQCAEDAGDLADLLPGLLRDPQPVGHRAGRVRLRELEHPEQAEQRVVQLVDNTGHDAAEREQAAGLGAIALLQVDSHTAYHRTDPSNEGRLSKVLGIRDDDRVAMSAAAPMTEPGAITCLVADDHPAVVQAVAEVLAAGGITIMGQDRDGEQALETIRKHKPMVALLDLRMPRMSGIEVCRAATRYAPETGIILYTAYGDRALLTEALDAGARGFVLKEAPLAEVVRAVELVADGRTYVDPVLAGVVTGGAATEKVLNLTQRERDVLRLLADGNSNEAIGKTLFISPETVRTHVRKAMTKLDADTRTQAVATALRMSLIA